MLLLACAAPQPAGSADTGPPGPVTDVVVIGAGPAGLAAAIDAWRAGAGVTILEREDTFGGSANWAGGLMLFSGSAEQSAAGITDSAEQLLSEWPAFTGGDTTDPWVRYYAENNVAGVHDWLGELGVAFSAPHPDPSAGTTERVLSVEGGGEALVAALEAELPDDAIRYGAQADDLVRDSDGRVTGVVWSDAASGESTTTSADTVIVATGGFMRNLERVRAERPDLATYDLRWGSWTGADGNGLALLESEGAAVQNLDAIGLYAHGNPAPGEGSAEMMARFMSRVPWFNVLGERFVDETLLNSFRTGALRAAQPDGDAWMLFDAGTAAGAVFTQDDLSYTLADLEGTGLLATAETLTGLADALAVDADALAATTDAYNAFVLTGTDDAWRSGDERHLAEPVGSPPFYAVPVAITVAKGFGGIDVDLDGRVLDTAGAVIPGLYAAGELTGMAGGSLVGDYGFTGSLSAVVLGGRVAGARAAEEAIAR